MENSIWKKLWTCHKTTEWMNDHYCKIFNFTTVHYIKKAGISIGFSVMADNSCTAKLASKILRRITRSLNRLDGLLLWLSVNKWQDSKWWTAQYRSNFMLLIPCMFLQSVYFPANAFCDTTYVMHIKTPKKGVCANLLLFILFSYKLH
jgi:hypothetical protein